MMQTQAQKEIECLMYYDIDTLSYDYNEWHIENAKFQQHNLDVSTFTKNFMLKNLPCIIKNVTETWKCTTEWVECGQINYDYLSKKYGSLIAPVADCKKIVFNAQCKSDMKVDEYIHYLMNPIDDKLLYLKDWHLKRTRPDDIFYEIPQYFIMDWLNEFAIDNHDDDFMFVYIGPKGSWTPLHEDVYCSYSWSVNVVGRKKWIIFPPGEEEKLKDKLGNLPLLFETEKYDNIKYFEVIQEKGDALFVPSGWHHQVVNELHTISINHNWINACNIEIVWKALQKSLLIVEHEIEELKNSPEFSAECQIILKSHFGMDFKSFAILLCHIAKKRLTQLESKSPVGLNQYSLGINTAKFDLKSILKVMNSICEHPLYHKNILSSIEDEFLAVYNNISSVFKISQI